MGVLPGDGGLLVVHLVPNFPVGLQLGLVLGVLLSGNLLLLGKGRLALGGIGCIVQVGYRAPGGGAAAQSLQMDDHVGGAGEQQLVVGDVEDGDGAGEEKFLQPLHGLHIQIVGRLVQQEQVGLGQQQQSQAQLHPFTPGQGGHGPPIVEQPLVQSQLSGGAGNLSGVGILKGGSGAAVVQHRLFQRLRG